MTYFRNEFLFAKTEYLAFRKISLIILIIHGKNGSNSSRKTVSLFFYFRNVKPSSLV
jgi:hypothetical protein